MPNGQDILPGDIGDGLIYNCFNRADENPFKKMDYNESGDGKSWSDWMRTPCKKDIENQKMRQILQKIFSVKVRLSGTIQNSANKKEGVH